MPSFLSGNQLPLILLTAFLDILGMSLLIPIFPDLTAHFHAAESWTMWIQSIYSLGMFLAGFVVGNLSDTYGRKNMLIVTSIFNLLGYIFSLMALSMGNPSATLVFGFYLVARFIAGIGGSWFAVVQAYISDISSSEEKTKNMGLIGAAFGTAFLIGPAIGGILANVAGLSGIFIISIVIITINLLWIIFWLPEPGKHVSEMKEVDSHDWKISGEIYFLLAIWLGAGIGFSIMQSGSGQYFTDRFWFNADTRWYTMTIVWLVSIIFQGFLVRYVRKVLNEPQMIQVWLFFLIFGMFFLAWNTIPLLVFFILILFPLGMGSFWPSVTALLAKDAGKHAGRIMGINTSMNGIWGIVWPIFTGWMYAGHATLPFWCWAALFLVLFVSTLVFFQTNHS